MDFTRFTPTTSQGTAHVNHNPRCHSSLKSISMQTDAAGCRHFRIDLKLRQRNGIITGRCGFVFVIKSRLHVPASFGEWHIGSIREYTKVPAINRTRAAQSRMTEAQNLRVVIIIARHVLGHRSIVGDCVRAKPHQPERHHGRRGIVSANVTIPASADKWVHMLNRSRSSDLEIVSTQIRSHYAEQNQDRRKLHLGFGGYHLVDFCRSDVIESASIEGILACRVAACNSCIRKGR